MNITDGHRESGRHLVRATFQRESFIRGLFSSGEDRLENRNLIQRNQSDLFDTEKTQKKESKWSDALAGVFWMPYLSRLRFGWNRGCCDDDSWRFGLG